MHSISRQGQFHGQIHGPFHPPLKGQIKARLGTKRPLSHVHPHAAHVHPHAAHAHAHAHVRGKPDSSPSHIDVCRLIVATLGLGLYLAIPAAAVGFALNLLFR